MIMIVKKKTTSGEHWIICLTSKDQSIILSFYIQKRSIAKQEKKKQKFPSD